MTQFSPPASAVKTKPPKEAPPPDPHHPFAPGPNPYSLRATITNILCYLAFFTSAATAEDHPTLLLLWPLMLTAHFAGRILDHLHKPPPL